jgi:hypothetical protein
MISTQKELIGVWEHGATFVWWKVGPWEGNNGVHKAQKRPGLKTRSHEEGFKEVLDSSATHVGVQFFSFFIFPTTVL